MSDAYSSQLVTEESTVFDRTVDAALGIALLTLLLGVAALFNLTSISATVAGVPLVTVLGTALVALSVAVLGFGIASRQELVDTDPDRTAGLIAGLGFGTVGLLLGTALGIAVLGFESPLWPLASIVTGFGLLVLTVLPREDIGSTVPSALVTLVFGVVLVTGLLGPGWQYRPAIENFSGGFTAQAVVPLLAVIGSLLSTWSIAKTRAGHGARGRELGAYMLIYVNGFAMLSVMLMLVLFVAERGAGYALDGLTIGGLSGLVVLSFPLVVLGNSLRRGLEFRTKTATASSLFRLGLFGLLGVSALACLYTLVTGTPIETSELVITPATRIGGWLLFFAGLALFALVRNRYTGLTSTKTTASPVALTTNLQRALAGLVVVSAVAFVQLLVVGRRLFGFPTYGIVWLNFIVALGILALPLALMPLATIVAGRLRGATLGQVVRERAPLLRFGVFGALSLLLTAVMLEHAASAVPKLLGLSVVPLAAAASSLVCLVLFLTVVGGRMRSEDHRTTDLLTSFATLAGLGVLGSLTILALHVSLVADGVGGIVVTGGAIDWPFVMQSYVPLGDASGGILPAIVGTVWLVSGATVFAVPLGVGAAIFLTEYAEQGRLTNVVEIATNALWSTPSVVFGLFGYAFLVPRLGGDLSLLAGMLVLGFMLLPLVLITSREALKSVPDEYRDASAALGVQKWETIRSVVLPAALPGVLTGVILGVGRIAGETAPLILVLGSKLNALEPVRLIQSFRFTGSPPFVANDVLMAESASLPTQIWAIVSAGVSGSTEKGWATAFILVVVVLTFYAVGIYGRKHFRRKLNYE